jgi:hypothetical protein
MRIGSFEFDDATLDRIGHDYVQSFFQKFRFMLEFLSHPIIQ